MQLPALFTEDWAGLKEWLSKTTLNRYEYALYDQPALYTDYELAFLPAAWPQRRTPLEARLTAWFTKPFFGAPVAKLVRRGAYAWVRKDVFANAAVEGWQRLPPEMAAFPAERHEDFIRENRARMGGRRLGMWKFGAE
jgi:hypothetical protein